MFRGDDVQLSGAVGQAIRSARDLGHPRVGSEHLVLALSLTGTAAGLVLARHGVTPEAVTPAVIAVAPSGSGAAADRDLMVSIGVDLDRLRDSVGGPLLDRPPRREPLFPLGVRAARRRCARVDPPIGTDFQAVYEASLKLALARQDREHRPEHLALMLVSLDPGANWVLDFLGVNRHDLLADLAATFPPPRRQALLRAKRRLALRSRHIQLVDRFQQLTGRTVVDAPAIASLIVGSRTCGERSI